LEDPKGYITELFYCFEAHRTRAAMVDHPNAKRVGLLAEDMDSDYFQGLFPERFRRWLRDDGVSEMYEDELPQLEKGATTICERERWDIYDEDGGLMYKHAIKTNLAAGVVKGGGYPIE